MMDNVTQNSYTTCDENKYISGIDSLISEYEKYYHGGINSIYSKRFVNKRVTSNEIRLINNLLYKTYNKFFKYLNSGHNNFKILDFGCGDGRIFDVIYNFINKTNNNHINYELVGYDPSLNGLKTFFEHLIKQGFSILEIDNANSAKNGYIFSLLKKGNILVKLIHANVHDNAQHIENLLGNNFHVIFNIFGAFSHIVGSKRRKEILRVFNNLLCSQGNIIIDVPTSKHFRNELLYYNNKRKNIEKADIQKAKELRVLLKLAMEDGDIYYKKNNSDVEPANYIHLYEALELYEDISSCNFKPDFPKITSIATPFDLTKSKFNSILDKYLSICLSCRIMPLSLIQRIGLMIYVTAVKL